MFGVEDLWPWDSESAAIFPRIMTTDISSAAGNHLIRIRCLLFGRYAELLEAESLPLEMPVRATAGDLVTRLRSDYPNGMQLPLQPLMAVNRRHVRLDAVLGDGDEVAVLPPLAGG